MTVDAFVAVTRLVVVEVKSIAIFVLAPFTDATRAKRKLFVN